MTPGMTVREDMGAGRETTGLRDLWQAILSGEWAGAEPSQTGLDSFLDRVAAREREAER
ncbi:hypothetical protein NHN26_16245 [Rhodovulum tesquicola]|uniref:hypothetical protein n=1 Tax=Rhodovulum tesquicola TaxID=540254 RepID=UPI002097FED9|nr:hypothetical protein [Rhodovulum tesquicola]MCO8146762.1 hypothetical protein [Rhodovulum tesquicola]